MRFCLVGAKARGGFESAAAMTTQLQLRILMRSKVFVYLSCALAALYFVVTGIQFWITLFFLECIGGNPNAILASFSVVSATGPTFGVIFGGWFIDKLGGYRGTEGMATTAKCLVCWALLAVGSAAPAGFYNNLTLVISLCWFLLFWGGAIVPAATGLILASVPDSLRSFSSAMSMLWYNVLGFAGGTFVPGIAMQIFDSMGLSKERQLAWGMRLIFGWSIFGLLFVSLAAYVTEQKVRDGLAHAAPEHTEAEAWEHHLGRRTRAPTADLLNGPNAFDGNAPLRAVSRQHTRYEMMRRESQMIHATGGFGALVQTADAESKKGKRK